MPAPPFVKRLTAKAFAALGPRNPLQQLSAEDKQLLWNMLFFYAFMKLAGHRWPNAEPFERVARTTRDAAKFAAKLEADVFQGPLAKELQPYFSGFEDLPKVLRAFANRVGEILDLLGKPGRQGELQINRRLVIASEFVRLRTGSYHDEHVAELLQGIRLQNEPDFSGDAIHKKRNYLKRKHPAFYQSIKEELAKLV